MSGTAKAIIKNSLISISMLALAFIFSVLTEELLVGVEYISMLFVFCVFLISMLTDGYLYGIASAFASVFAVNYAFTFPYFAFNFTLPGNFISALIMIVISLMTSAITTRLKESRAAKAEGEKEKMRANLLRAVSHDLRTPLTTIYGSSSTILDNSETLSEEQKLRMVSGIKEDSEWLIRMVENLLSVTRIDSGAVDITKVPTVLEELIDTVLLKFKKRYASASVKLRMPEEILVIPMDPMLIGQVLINLLENAVQHATGMTELSLRVFELGDQAIFEVSDDGCGIERERLDKIFTGYYDSSEQSSDKSRRYSGIGLSVCATIVKAHGGTIKAESTLGEGSVFRFSLPILEEEDER